MSTPWYITVAQREKRVPFIGQTHEVGVSVVEGFQGMAAIGVGEIIYNRQTAVAGWDLLEFQGLRWQTWRSMRRNHFWSDLVYTSGLK